ncbi:hypothetical protein IAT38_008175 [Cryptococcus sp. DSM 104549]
MRVAVIGSGLAGLTTSYLLRRQGVEVWLLERSPKLGFHSESVEVIQEVNGEEKENPSKRWIVDVPMRGFQGGYYPLLLSLYTHLGIPVTSTSYSFSFSSSSDSYFIHSGASGYSLPSLPRRAFTGPVKLVRAIVTFLGVALCYILLLALAFLSWHDLLPSPLSTPNLTLRQFTSYLAAFLARPITIPVIGWAPRTPLGGAFESFIATIILPLFSAVGTMTSDDVWSLPMEVLLEYVHTTLATAHYHLANGFSSADVARLLAAPVLGQGEEYVRLNTEVVGLEYAVGGGVRVRLRSVNGGSDGEGDGEEEGLRVDKVVLASQASVARKLLEGLQGSLKQWGEEKERRRVARMSSALADVLYRETIVINHRDTSVLPARADQRDINLFTPSAPTTSSPEPAGLSTTPYFPPSTDSIYTMSTQVIPPPPGAPRLAPVLQTTNPVVPLDESLVLSVSRLERALPASNSAQTLESLRAHSLNALVYLAGSYVYPGIPLLEGCVGSAKLAVEAMLEADQYHHERRLAESGRKSEQGKGKKAKKAKAKGDEGCGGVDWDVGRGGRVMRAWRWRWHKRGVWN